jgi:hypothetical protein
MELDARGHELNSWVINPQGISTQVIKDGEILKAT